MTLQSLLDTRLINQQIAANHFQTPGEVVKWLGAIQAQDYLGALWAVGCRLKGMKQANIEKAITDKTIIRTWPMRGTLHFVPPEDAKWMLQLLTPRVIARAASEYRKSGLDKKVFTKSKDVFLKALEGGKILSRKEMYEALEKAKIDTAGTRGLHILGVLAQEGLICFGPRVGKQQGFVLLEEWIPNSKTVNGDEALTELSLRYFTGHGPATMQDFAWWSGLTITEAKKAIGLVKKILVEVKLNGQSYWMKEGPLTRTRASGIYLLPAFDEYLVGYKDRSAALESLHLRKVFTINGIFNPVVIINGKIAAVWKRNLAKNEVVVQLEAFQSFTLAQKEGIRKAAKKYSTFIGLDLKLLY